MSSENNCEYCDKKFATKQTKDRHIKICKIYLKNKEEENKKKEEELIIRFKEEINNFKEEIQQLKNKEEEYKKNEKDFIIRLNEEYTKKETELINKFKEEIYELKIKIAKLESENEIYKSHSETSSRNIVDIAMQPTTTNNNNSGNSSNTTYKNKITIPLDLRDPETISEVQNKLKINLKKEHILDGQRGVAKLVVNHLLLGDEGKNNKYVCTDFSRSNFKYIDKNGNTQVDNGGKNLTNLVYEGVKEEVYDIAKVMMNNEDDEIKFDMITKGVIDFKKLKEDNTKFINEVKQLAT